ncbi:MULTISPECIES: cysteine desulfurase SufS [Providencia]|uniref:cysteine desulfurase SufS n=1 Tax=Providencia TaxID=586 RepID=UPI00197EC12D|nr:MULTISPECIES: cysteine desulfurase SufS [Providencia]HEC8329241.1 cysteine desulfurase SufS [Providencia rettgeri]MBN4865242.1 cysteine desulfurase SufS [Providencia stuartii]MBN4874532.1 cysteine desulfurase SufS [Providencia stuartii]MBN4879255.1 cysteine desulfurase SufS [Providencia stuartii]MBN4883733.1 cysteine desulfurase SufS [Providencia stuartii]
MSFDVALVRQDFPALSQSVNNHPLVYLDSAASAQKPLQVIERESEFTLHQYAAVHRGIHTLSANATTMMEEVRQKAADFINAGSNEEIVFVKGTTEGINLVANSYGRKHLFEGDNIVITEMEHHANIVPWFLLAEEIGFEVRVIPISDDGTLQLDKLNEFIDARTRLLSFTHISNVLGTVNPVKEIIQQARDIASQKSSELAILVDGAQGAMHQQVDVQDLDCDFYVFSGHKLYGPTGIGILFGKKAILDVMPPWEGGGAMIRQVSLTKGITFADAPWRFEAGTPNVSAIIGLGAAFDYLTALNLRDVFAYEAQIMAYASQKLKDIPSIRLYGNDQREGVLAFNLGEHHAYDVGSFLDRYGIAIRTGHHCALPLMEHYHVPAMCRASVGIYTTKEDIDALFNALQRIKKLLG